MPQSESVWFEQVDTALIAHIKNIVRLPDSSGVLSPVPVIIRKPDEDFKVEQYPCISLYNLYSRRDKDRYYSDPVVTARDEVHKTMTLEKAAIPFSLYYQMDFWSTSITQMNEMTRRWLSATPEQCFNLPVIDLAGKSRSSFVLETDSLRKSDILTSKERTFHSFLTYRVWVELDDRVAETKPMVVTGVPVTSKKP